MQSTDKTQERATENREIQSKVQTQQRGEGEEAGRQTKKYYRSEIQMDKTGEKKRVKENCCHSPDI